MDEENTEPFGFDVASIDYVLLTHAHLDHCGRLPLLTKQGFRGEIITTSASRELTRLVILDAAYLMEEDARHRARKGGHGGGAGNGTKETKQTQYIKARLSDGSHLLSSANSRISHSAKNNRRTPSQACVAKNGRGSS